MTKDSEPKFGIIFIIFLQSKYVKKKFSSLSHLVSKICIYIFLILNGMSRFIVGLHKVSKIKSGNTFSHHKSKTSIPRLRQKKEKVSNVSVK